MMDTSFAFLSRYRSAFVAVTALAAGCTIFLFKTSSWPLATSVPPPQNGLHRSNARRRRHPRTGDLQSLGGTSSGERDSHDVESSIDSAPGDLMPTFVSSTGRLAAAGVTPAAGHPIEEDLSTELSYSLDSEDDWNEENSTTAQDKNRLELLYRIAQEQEVRQGYVHRGINCNNCSEMPIRGIRFKCANCVDFDLCEMCEALQDHARSHVFYKIRLPVPFMSAPNFQPQPLWYPGKPSQENQCLKPNLLKAYSHETGYQTSQIEASWDLFRVSAATNTEDSDHHCLAIDRQCFDKCFNPNNLIRSTSTNLMFERMFGFYDINQDGLVDFAEFLSGIQCLTEISKNEERLRRICVGYDTDRNGWVDRKDFLRMFRAYYAINKELTKQVLVGWEDNRLKTREALQGSQPISSMFNGEIPEGERSRTGEGKIRLENGDEYIHDGADFIREPHDDPLRHNEVLADLVETKLYGNLADPEFRELEDWVLNENDKWPPKYVVMGDVLTVLNREVAFEDIDDPDVRKEIQQVAINKINANKQQRLAMRKRGVEKRWERRQFYIDKENGARPPPESEPKAKTKAARPSHRSRKSSKMPSQNSRSTVTEPWPRNPIGESEEVYEVPEAEKDIGQEVLYQVTQESLNELLNPLFELREDLSLAALRTQTERVELRPLLDAMATENNLRWVQHSLQQFQTDVRLQGLIAATTIAGEPLRSVLALVTDSEPLKLALLRVPATNQESPTTHDLLLQLSHDEELLKSGADIFDSGTLSCDPTLPQYRPNSNSPQTPEPLTATSSKTPTSHIDLTSQDRSIEIPAAIPRPMYIRSLFLLAMEFINDEDQHRGGGGRLSYAEFAETMNGIEGPRLGFVGAWADMALF